MKQADKKRGIRAGAIVFSIVGMPWILFVLLLRTITPTAGITVWDWVVFFAQFPTAAAIISAILGFSVAKRWWALTLMSLMLAVAVVSGEVGYFIWVNFYE